MTSTKLSEIVDAVLYEGFILYPYRPSTKKNGRERFTFGRLYPKEYADSQNGAEPWRNQTQCLFQAQTNEAALEISVRFLHLMWREAGFQEADGAFLVQSQLAVNGELHLTWQEAVEREMKVTLGPLDSAEPLQIRREFAFPASRVEEPLAAEEGKAKAALVRRQEALSGAVEVEAAPVGGRVFRITVRVENRTPLPGPPNPDAVAMKTFASVHTILTGRGGEFISLLDPPELFRKEAAACKNIGTWPVLVGEEERLERDTMLSSPIILYDYPRVAPESAGNFFDGTEIDEMLTLRVLTMTDREKLEMRGVDEFARRILERTEATTADDLLRMHGTLRKPNAARDLFNPTRAVQDVFTQGRRLSKGTRVRVQPKRRADAIDMMIAGKVAVVEAIEEDAEHHVHLALVLEEDPGKDLGWARQPGHRFFYSVDEVEPLEEAVS